MFFKRCSEINKKKQMLKCNDIFLMIKMTDDGVMMMNSFLRIIVLQLHIMIPRSVMHAHLNVCGDGDNVDG